MKPHEIRLIGGPRDGERMTIPGSTFVYGILVFEKLDVAAARRAMLDGTMHETIATGQTRYYRHAIHGDTWLHQDLMAALEDSIDAAHTHTTH